MFIASANNSFGAGVWRSGDTVADVLHFCRVGHVGSLIFPPFFCRWDLHHSQYPSLCLLENPLALSIIVVYYLAIAAAMSSQRLGLAPFITSPTTHNACLILGTMYRTQVDEPVFRLVMFFGCVIAIRFAGSRSCVNSRNYL